MSRHWKEPYSFAKARQLQIRDVAANIVVGQYLDPNLIRMDADGVFRRVALPALSKLTESAVIQLGRSPVNEWIYHVSVCRFTFAFFALEEITEYAAYYSVKLLPSRRLPPHDKSHRTRQSQFNRLPAYLRETSKRPRVVKALQNAYADFQKLPDIKQV